jgi:hypothetical protein
MIEGSGSGSRRPKNTLIRIRIRIRNTAWSFEAFKSAAVQIRAGFAILARSCREIFSDPFQRSSWIIFVNLANGLELKVSVCVYMYLIKKQVCSG